MYKYLDCALFVTSNTLQRQCCFKQHQVAGPSNRYTAPSVFVIPTSTSCLKVPVILSNMRAVFLQLSLLTFRLRFTFLSCQHTEPSSDVTFCLICSISQARLWHRFKDASLPRIFCRDTYELLPVIELLSPVHIQHRDYINHVQQQRRAT